MSSKFPELPPVAIAVGEWIKAHETGEEDEIFQRHKDLLLGYEADNFLSQFISWAENEGNLKFVSFLNACQRYLREITCQNIPKRHYDTVQQLNLNNSAVDDLQRYKAYGRLADLDTALSKWQLLVDSTSTKPLEKAMYLNNLAGALRHHYLHTGKPTGLTQAIECWKQAIALTPDNSLNKAGYLQGLSVGLHDYYKVTGKLEDLNQTIKCCEQALTLFTSMDQTKASEPEKAPYLNILSLVLSDRYYHAGEVTDLEQAIKHIKEAVKITPDSYFNKAMYLNNLALVIRDNYYRTGGLENIREAIEYSQKAVNLCPDNSYFRANCFDGLGTGLRDSYKITGEVAELTLAIEYYRQAVDSTPTNSPTLSVFLNNLGAGLWKRYMHLENLQDLQDSIVIFQKTIKITSPDSSNYLVCLNNLGSTLLQRYELLKDPLDMQKGIERLRQATEGTPSNSPELSSRLGNLAGGLMLCYLQSSDPTDLQASIKTYKQAIEHGSQISLQDGANAARSWFNFAYQRNSWQEIEEIYPKLKEISDKLVATQLLREYQGAFLTDTQGIAPKVAYARIQTGNLPEAVEALEQGVARLLSAALMRSRADLIQLEQDAPELHTAYQDALDKLRATQQAHRSVAPEHQAEAYQRLKEANQAFDDTLVQIRQLKGHENFLLVATDLNIVYQTAEKTPLVYLFTTKGGYALVVFQEKIQAIALPELTETVLIEEMERYFDVYNLRSNDFQAWFNAIEAITQWLWQVIWQPLYEVLSHYQPITLIPVGLLNLLPIHAAWTPDSTQPTGKRYALDDFTISYAPNALSLQKAKERKFLKPDCLLAIDEPKPVDANSLPSSSIEVKAIAQYFQQPQLYRHQQATLENIKNALSLEYTVLHLSCHGGANFQNPLKTGLLMANNEILTVQDFFDVQLQARLVTLSACETGMIGTKQIEEVVGLPASLLQAGVAGVVASL